MTDSPAPATNATEYTVSEISGALKRTVEDTFGNVRVRGEISGYRGPHSSGHAYFALKDERSRLEAVIWKGTFSRLRFRPEEGMEVIAQGRLTTYPGSSKYQIVIDSLEPAGAGALMALLDERRRRLAAEGLFDDSRKRRLPYLPRVIGVVTSPTGAVIRDIIHRIADRFPLHVIVWPVRVQGETTGAEVSAAVDGFNRLDPDGPVPRPDVIIVARGGGSLEDLWGFNDEAVVRAVAASEIPVISAVGHETDWTLIDLAADLRAPTPTGAAELAVPVRAELDASLATLGARLSGAVRRAGEQRRQALRAAARALPSADQLFAVRRQRFDVAAGRLERALTAATERRRARLAATRLEPAMLARSIAEAGRHLDRCGGRFAAVAAQTMRERAVRLATTSRRLSPAPLTRRIDLERAALQRSSTLADRAWERRHERHSDRLHRAELRLRPEPIAERIARRAGRLEQAARLLASVSYESVLARGFVLVADQKGALVKRAAQLSGGEQVTMKFADGERSAVTLGADAPAPRRPAAPRAGSGTQGSLF